MSADEHPGADLPGNVGRGPAGQAPREPESGDARSDPLHDDSDAAAQDDRHPGIGDWASI